jgi:hypothetical protein
LSEGDCEARHPLSWPGASRRAEFVTWRVTCSGLCYLGAKQIAPVASGFPNNDGGILVGATGFEPATTCTPRRVRSPATGGGRHATEESATRLQAARHREDHQARRGTARPRLLRAMRPCHGRRRANGRVPGVAPQGDRALPQRRRVVFAWDRARAPREGRPVSREQVTHADRRSCGRLRRPTPRRNRRGRRFQDEIGVW